MPLQTRRGIIVKLTAGLAGLLFVVGAAFADELLGTIIKADAESKTLTVVAKDTDKEVKVKVTDKTEYVTKKGSGKVDFEKVEKGIEKAKERGRKGIMAKITHEDGVASKIEAVAKKKAE
ncbi:hypothetical protein OJF2_46770 [Aquisphaera giovannonii]|uniref:Uncharacterized protein n=1 Tax=Aquisphaera giovannonii TaxID=406548 RepID=A0A5B9W6Z2_9BACT|nr:hypothetical protein [Aquisphaera giovannonii]QEH36117.1 hypothetical protein OJF2_46770 [Aquisphaera giovannonii]